MRTLILETSTEKSCLILAEDGAVRASKSLQGGPELSKRLALETACLLKEAPGPIDFITVGEGPGSYTGTRVGAALAKGLSFGWKVPLYGFCSLKAFAPDALGSFAILIDARMGGFYFLIGERIGKTFSFGSPLLAKPEQAAALLEGIETICSPHPSEIERRLPKLRLLEKNPDPALLAKWAFSKEFQTPFELTYLSSP